MVDYKILFDHLEKREVILISEFVKTHKLSLLDIRWYNGNVTDIPYIKDLDMLLFEVMDNILGEMYEGEE